MSKTNIIYKASISDNGSTLSSETPFSDENVSNLKSSNIDDCLFVWGNAYRNVGYATKSNDTSPTSGALTFTSNSPYTNSSVPHTQTVVSSSFSIGLDLGSQQYADRIRIITNGFPQYANVSFFNQAGNAFTVYYSNDNSTWTSLATYSFTGISVTGGEIVLSFTRTSARYFKITTSASGMQVQQSSPFSFSIDFYYQKVFIMDTTAGNQFKSKIDLGKVYKSPKIYIQTRLKRDHLNWSVKSSSDDISYTANTLSFGNTWTSLASTTTFGRLLYNVKTGKLFNVSTTGIYEYNFQLNTWSAFDTTASLLPYLSMICDIDQDNNVIYSYGTNKVVRYFIDTKTYSFLPDPPLSVPSNASAIFAFGSFFLAINKSSTISVTHFSSRLGSMFLCYNHLDDKWRMADFRNVSDTNINGLTIQPIRFPYNSIENMYISGFNVYGGGSDTVIPPNGFAYSLFSGSTFDGNISTSGLTINQKQGQYTNTVGGRPQAVYDSDKGFLFSMPQQNGNIGGTPYIRRVDYIIDVINTDIYMFPDNNYNSAGQTYHLGGLEPFGYNSMVYVPDTKSIYRTGSFELTGASTDFKYYDTEEFISIKASLNTNTRYITIDNTTTGHWPMMLNQILVIEDNNEVGFGTDPSSFFIRKNMSFNITNGSSIEEIPVYNNKTVATPSGYVYIEPDGSEGSRVFQIGESNTGPWHSHCIYNDLTNSQCTAGSSLYGTSRCSIACTSGTAGISATGFYTMDTISISATVSGTDFIYVKSTLPTFANSEDKPFDIIAEYYE